VKERGKVDLLKQKIDYFKSERTLICVHMADDVEGDLMPLLASISEVPVETSAGVSDDPFSRFISLRNSATARAVTNLASVNSALLPGLYCLTMLRNNIRRLGLRPHCLCIQFLVLFC